MKHLPMVVLLCTLLFLAACGTAPAEEPDLVATQVAVERAAAATLTAEAIPPAAGAGPTNVAPPQATVEPTAAAPDPTATSTERSGTPTESSGTPTQVAVVVQPVFTPTQVPPTPTPTPTQITAVVFPVDGSDGDKALHGSFVQSNGGRNVILPGVEQNQVTNPMVFRERLPVRVEVFDENVGQQDGDGIAAVDFNISGPSGESVLRIIEQTAPYCLWGGNDPACPAPSFADLGYVWPQTGTAIENDFHQAAIIITGTNDTSITWFWTFEIDHGQAAAETETETAAAAVEVVLRPACADRVTVPTGAPINLIYGIWANRDLYRASQNEAYIQIDLTVDNQPISGDRVLPPVADLPQAICGRDYEDSYWVYHTAQLPALTPGVHSVTVSYRFTQPVDDGYGSTYTQPFTQQYQIVVE